MNDLEWMKEQDKLKWNIWLQSMFTTTNICSYNKYSYMLHILKIKSLIYLPYPVRRPCKENKWI